jgi:NADH:ubiquinone oxidoreductase subunit C
MEIVRNIKEIIGKDILESQVPRPRRIFISVPLQAFKKTLILLSKKMGFNHISTITGVDVGKEIEVIYHLNHEGKTELSLKTRVTKKNSVLPTITNIIPGATLYEREIHELLGVKFKNHPDLSPLILPENWPSKVHPLRKEWTIEKIRNYLKGEKK